MLKYASRTRLVIFTILSIIGIAVGIAGTVLTIIHNDPVYECCGILIALFPPSLWTLLLRMTDRGDDFDERELF
jgi:hypothetical protein